MNLWRFFLKLFRRESIPQFPVLADRNVVLGQESVPALRIRAGEDRGVLVEGALHKDAEERVPDPVEFRKVRVLPEVAVDRPQQHRPVGRDGDALGEDRLDDTARSDPRQRGPGEKELVLDRHARRPAHLPRDGRLVGLVIETGLSRKLARFFVCHIGGDRDVRVAEAVHEADVEHVEEVLDEAVEPALHEPRPADHPEIGVVVLGREVWIRRGDILYRRREDVDVIIQDHDGKDAEGAIRGRLQGPRLGRRQSHEPPLVVLEAVVRADDRPLLIKPPPLRKTTAHVRAHVRVRNDGCLILHIHDKGRIPQVAQVHLLLPERLDRHDRIPKRHNILKTTRNSRNTPPHYYPHLFLYNNNFQSQFLKSITIRAIN